MSRISIPKRSIHVAAAILGLIGLLAPAQAHQPAAGSVFPDLPIIAAADHAGAKAAAASRSIKLTSRRPWLALVGHRQPQLADVLKSETVSVWEQQQQQFDHELDRKLIVCRGC